MTTKMYGVKTWGILNFLCDRQYRVRIFYRVMLRRGRLCPKSLTYCGELSFTIKLRYR